LSPEQLLKKYWGYDHFRPLQKDAVTSILNGQDTLALMPTGAGKSLCYQVPALCMDGFCLVISPLISLMQDQVARLQEVGIMAECIHAGLQYHEVKDILSNTVRGTYKLLYVSPERLQTKLFSEYLPEFNINLIAIDEAHCVSQWGYDFRPDYLKIASLRTMFHNVPFIALTASATQEVEQDIITHLQLNQPAIHRQSIARPNIFYKVQYTENKNAEVLSALLPNATSIIYCRSRRQTEALTKYLNQTGHVAIAYHAGMKKAAREEGQRKWMELPGQVMVATTAFGMGIDKKDVRTVIHYDTPEHPEAYYQEAGRAGRDGLPAIALMLYNSKDMERLEESTDLLFPPDAYLREVYQAVVEYLQVPISGEPDRYFSFNLADFCKKFKLQATRASNALRLLEQEGLWTITDAVFSPATIQFVTDRHVLDQLVKIEPWLHLVSTALLRLYGTIYSFPTTVNIDTVARQVRMNKNDVERAIQQLHSMQILEYNTPGEGPQLFFHHYRVDSRHLIINHKRITMLRNRHLERTNAMIRFVNEKDTCRERMLKTYFGEQSTKDCGHCDICLSKTNAIPFGDAELRIEILKVLQQQGPITIQKLVNHFNVAIKTQIISLVREMIDGDIVTLNNAGMLSLTK